MRSSSARPMPRSAITTPSGGLPPQGRPTPLPRQNGGGNVPNSRDASRSKASTQHLQNGRAPSVPATPRIVNKKYAHIKSKVNSITAHSAAPSSVKIFHEPVKVSATPRVGSLQNANHMPTGGNVKIENRKLNFRETAKPKVEAKSETPIPKSDKKIPTQKLVWKAESKVGSLENATHKPGGGQLKIFNETVKVNAESKVGSLDNIGHTPGGGNVKISDYSHSISGTGSVRSRRDTADSGRSSSSHENGQMMGEHHHHQQQKQQELEILITPRELAQEDEDAIRRRGNNGLQNQTLTDGVAEGQLINFG